MNPLRIIVSSAACAFVAAAAFPAAAQTIAIENATVHVAPGTAIEGATVVIRNGTIAAVGKNAAVPAGATRVDGTGKVVTAGLIDAISTLGLVEVSAERTTVEGSFRGGRDDAVHAAYRVTDGYHTGSVAIPVARTGGITAAVTVPRGGLIAGQSAWMSLADDVDPATLAVRDPAAMHVSFGIDAMGATGGSRGIAVERLRELLDDAKQYARNRRAFAQRRTRDYAAERLDLEALVKVVRGELPLAVTAHRASDILAALRVAREHDIRVIIVGGTEAWTVAKHLARADTPVILDPTANLPSTFDRIRVRNDAAKVLRDAGVTVAISTLGDGSNARTLRQLAGVAVAYGLNWNDALAAVTTAPAAIYGVKDAGTLEPGKRADVVVWTGDPLELSSRPERMYVRGVEQSLRTRQTRLLERYRAFE